METDLQWRLNRADRRDRLCVNCHTVGRPRLITRGSLLVELALWLCLIVPGLIYSIWRHATRYHGCPACGSRELIPCDAPRAQELARRR